MRKPCPGRLALSLSFGLLIAALAVGAAIISRLGLADARLDKLESAVVLLGGRIDSADRHVAELARVSHERRAILADELRKEAAAGQFRLDASLKELLRNVADYDSHADALYAAIKALESGVGTLDGRTNGLKAAVGAFRDEIKAIDARVKTLEARKPEVRTVETRVVERPACYPVQYLYPVLPCRGR